MKDDKSDALNYDGCAATGPMSYFGLAGKTALVTGASSGLGLHFARTLAAAGCHVGLAARRADRLESVVEDLTGKGLSASPLPLDVRDRQAVDEAFETLSSRTGKPVTILVNNAGIAPPSGFLNAEDDETAEVFALNQSAVWNVAQTAARRMVAASSGGSIINVASILGVRPVAGAAAYAVSKAAVVQLTQVMALELARHDIRVNALAPGYFKTDINASFLESAAGEKLIKRIPMRRTGSLQDLEGALLLLASERSAYISGAILPIDGAHLCAGL